MRAGQGAYVLTMAMGLVIGFGGPGVRGALLGMNFQICGRNVKSRLWWLYGRSKQSMIGINERLP